MKPSGALLGGLAALAIMGVQGCGGGGGDSVPLSPTPVAPGDSGPDPLYSSQWHLRNHGDPPYLLAGEDINVEPVWNDGAKGNGVLLVVVDDGLEIGHEDLAANVAIGKGWDYHNSDTDPTPSIGSTLSHGTKVAGIAAARDLNSLGGRGVAPRATLAGYNLLDSGALPTDIYDAMTRNAAEVAVSNNSWGMGREGVVGVAEYTDYLWQQSVAYGVTNGRGGNGTVYVWAAGNDGAKGDNSNYDFMANNRHVMAVCAVNGKGGKTSYSEPGANLWLCAPAGDYYGLTTTDLMGEGGDNHSGVDDYSNRSYTGRFVGTSAATPIVSGVVALMLEANPDLGWRDVRLILAETARKNDAGDTDWRETKPANGQPTYRINHKYGFGVVDAAAAVAKAKSWTNVGSQAAPLEFSPPSSSSAISIPDNDSNGVTQSVVVASDLIIEYVEVDVNITGGDPGDLRIVLTAPSATESVLAETHTCTVTTGAVTTHICPTNNYFPWTFGSSRHLGESSKGEWKLQIVDQRANNLGSLISWKLRIYGRQP